jgi:hypothetical protein
MSKETEPGQKKTIFPCWDNGKKTYNGGGRVQCDVCGSFAGMRVRSYYRKNQSGEMFPKLFRRCVNCKSLEITNNYTGEILKQETKGGSNENRFSSEGWENIPTNNCE